MRRRLITNESIRQRGYYTIDEAAQYLGVHRSTLTRWTQRGMIRVFFNKTTMRKAYLGSDLRTLAEAFV